MTNTQRIFSLRSFMQNHHYDAFLLPVTDEYQGEYSADYARRVTWLTGFDGSAGTAIIGLEQASLLVDGRYTLQAANEVDSSLIEVHDSASMSIAAYLKSMEARIIAYDPWLHTIIQIRTLQDSLGDDVTLIALAENPVDTLWEDQPPRPLAPVSLHDQILAGRSAHEKIADVTAKMNGDALLLTQPEDICWLLNLRGADIPYNPLMLCYAVLEKTGIVQLFIHEQKIRHLTLPACLKTHSESNVANFLRNASYTSLQLDEARTPIAFAQMMEGSTIICLTETNPITLLKAVKNKTEIANMRRAHEVDGVAVTKFIRWFHQLPDDKQVTELDVIKQLETFRREHPDYVQPSFATIAGAGEHGAIVHYRADAKSNRTINIGDALLLDSGGQYHYGTTDITRTLYRGKAPDAFKHHFTLVLKGHIALAQAMFPAGTTGSQLDVLARQFLWSQQLDYAHGTGHGVGHYLCVHEGPQSISSRPSTTALQPGMILSNEPGYYLSGAYGIRIESLVLVVEKGQMHGKTFYGFDTISRAPIDETLVDNTLMTDAEQAWLINYNALCVYDM